MSKFWLMNFAFLFRKLYRLEEHVDYEWMSKEVIVACCAIGYHLVDAAVTEH
jgi:hypothetical protein